MKPVPPPRRSALLALVLVALAVPGALLRAIRRTWREADELRAAVERAERERLELLTGIGTSDEEARRRRAELRIVS